MTNRAHHPADRQSGEYSSEERLTPGTGESGRVAMDEAVSQEFPKPLSPAAQSSAAGPSAHAEGSALDDDDDDAEEVVLEPDSIDSVPVEPERVQPSLAESAAVERETQELGSTPPPVAVEPPPLPADVAHASSARPEGESLAGDAATPAAPATTVATLPTATRATGTNTPAGLDGSEASRADALTPAMAPPRPTPLKSSPVAASTPEPSRPDAASGPRRVSRPPPLGPALTAAELEASRGAFTRDSAPEMTAAELQRAAGGEATDGAWTQPGPAPADGAKRPSFRPPFVDEVPDPVTPYEQRISETVKVADLPPVEQLRGRVLANRYLAEEVAEHTASSISYRAYHLALDRAVTVRVLLRGLSCSDETCQEVRRVAAVASGLGNAHVASTLDFGVLSDGWPFVVTEHFQGNTLAAILSREGKFVLRRVLHVGKQIALGLSAAHQQGVVHGLLSPDNVLVVDPGTSAEVAKILGFGISLARGAVPGPPRSGVFGVPFYVSPEQAACKPIDARSDIYSMGVILYELMTGAPPFSDGDFAGVLCQHLDDDAPAPSTRLPTPGALAKALDAIIERCLRKEPEKRYQTAAELADDLVRLEAAAARTKRRPMPEVQKPTTTIHSPHPKAEAPEVPGAKVIVHDDVDDDASPEPPEASAARRSSPSLTRSSPPAASQAMAKPAGAKPAGSGAPPAGGSSTKPTSRPPPMTAVAPVVKPVRVRVDQATIKISAVDRARLLAERQNNQSGWLGSVVAKIRRLLAAERGSSDDTR